MIAKRKVMVAAFTLLAVTACMGEKRPVAIERSAPVPTAATTEEGSTQVKLSAEEKVMLRQFVPNGGKITEADIARKLSQVQADPPPPKLVMPRKQRDVVLDTAKQKEETLQRQGPDFSSVRLKALVDGKAIRDKSVLFKGALTKTDPQRLTLRDSATQKELVLDYSWSPGINLSALKPNVDVKGIWAVQETPVGEFHGVALRDRKGLLFASEKRFQDQAAQVEEVSGITLQQKKEDLGDVVRSSKCSRLYHPEVMVKASGMEAPLILKNGQNALVNLDNSVYLVKIVKSQYLEEVKCGISFEEAPYQLEYVVQRLDDRKAITNWRNKLRGDALPDPRLEDNETVSVTGDGPPNAELVGDQAPKQAPLWDMERGLKTD